MMTKTYALTDRGNYQIHDRGEEYSPVERLQKEGGDVVNVNDLLRISLGPVEGLERAIQDYGVSFLATLHTTNDITESLGLDEAEATRLLAILSLGKRLYAASQGSLNYIRGIEDVFRHYRAMSHLAKEQLRVALINSRYQLIHEETLAIGGIENLTITARDVFQSAVERRVVAIVLVHNHPSGDPTPSESDVVFTKEMQKAGQLLGIELLDHVIIGSDSYASCMTEEKGRTKEKPPL
jgi:DNA repair protein RadC